MALKRLNNRHIKFAAGRVAGKTLRQLAEELGVSIQATESWSKDPLVKAKSLELAHLRDESLLRQQVLTKDEALVTLSDVIRGAAVIGKFILPDGTLDIERAKEEAPEVMSALAGVEPTRAGAKVKTYQTQDEANQDLAAGRLDAVQADAIALDAFLGTDQGKACCDKKGNVKEDPEVLGPGVGGGVRKDDTALREKLNAAIKKVRESGEYDKLTKKYFDFDIYGG